MPKYSVVVRQMLCGTFEIEATSDTAARRRAQEMGLYGWEDPDDGWNLLDEEVDVVPSASGGTQAGG
jgi:hypothetical protein